MPPGAQGDRAAGSNSGGQAEGGAGHASARADSTAGRSAGPDAAPQDVFPVSTHGGLLGYGAPWEVPAMYAVAEAVEQLRREAAGRQLSRARAALVYGNGGVFSAAAVAVLRARAPAARL
jgi:acetyl-CoA acetyltransferase